MAVGRLPVPETHALRCILNSIVDRRSSFLVAFFYCLLSVAGIAADVQVNLRDHDAPASQLEHTAQNEPSLAVAGSLVVVGFNSTKQMGQKESERNPVGQVSLNGYAYSEDKGGKFTDGGFVPAHGHHLHGDPALAFGPNGTTLYYASMGFETVTRISRIFVSPSISLSPVTFGAPAVISGLEDKAFQDKELIAVDTTDTFGGRVYVAWSEFPGGRMDAPFGNSRILFAASKSTAPLEFSRTQRLDRRLPTDLPTENNHGAMPAVAPNGDVYVVWSSFRPGAQRKAAPQTIQIVRSRDGGTKFENPDAADSNPSKNIAPNAISTVGSLCDAKCPRGLNIRTRGFPHIAIDHTPAGSPTRGNIYVVFQATPPSPSSARSQIFFTRSTDQGKTWDMPRSISNGPAVTRNGDTTQNDNWQPSIAVSPANGHIRVIFYSRREDPKNNIEIRVYDAGSSDGGLTWFNRPRSTVAFKPSTDYDPVLMGGEGHMGDYISVVASGSNFYAAWTDTRNICAACQRANRGDQDIFFSIDAAQ